MASPISRCTRSPSDWRSFVPLDFSFSCWFFFVARKLFQVFGAASGLDGPGSQGFPYFEQQASGAWIAWGLTIVWALRKQFRLAWRIAWGREDKEKRRQGEEETGVLNRKSKLPQPRKRQYRGAFIGIGVGMAILAGYSCEDRADALGGGVVFRAVFSARPDADAGSGGIGNAARDLLRQSAPDSGHAVRQSGDWGAEPDRAVHDVLVQPGLSLPSHAQPTGSHEDGRNGAYPAEFHPEGAGDRVRLGNAVRVLGQSARHVYGRRDGKSGGLQAVGGRRELRAPARLAEHACAK